MSRSSALGSVVVFVVFTVMFFIRSDKGMMDDPGLGWHLRIADRMWETGSFLYVDEFSTPSLGKPFVTYSWFGDVLMWLCDKWSGLDGVALLTAITFALTLQLLFWRITREGISWIVALAWTVLAAFAILPMCLAVPNMFTYLGIATTVAVCELFHAGAITRRRTLCLIPVFLLWANLHSGFLSGALVLVVTYATELVLAVVARGEARSAAQARLLWWTGLGALILLATMLNPNGWHLHGYLAGTANDDFMRRETTLGWLPPDFLMTGWGWAEIAVLLFPILLATSRFRVAAVPLALCIVFLHYGLTGMRYTGLWVVIAVPTLARLAEATALRDEIAAWFERNTSLEFRSRFAAPRGGLPWLGTLAAALLLVFASRWLPPYAKVTLPTATLDRLLEISAGKRVFHDANWGGYLTWFGRRQTPPYQTWIDDRIDVHGRDLLVEYRHILNARHGWDAKLDEHGIEFVSLEPDAEVVAYLRSDPRWSEVYSDAEGVIYRRR